MEQHTVSEPKTRSNINILKVLVSDVDLKHGLAAARMLGKSGASVDGIANSPSSSGLSRYIKDISYQTHNFNEDNIDAFVTFLSQSSYDVFLPITAKAVALAATYRSEIEKYCAVPLPEKAAIDLCFDKVRTAIMAEGIGIKCPRTWDFKCSKDLWENVEEIVFPVVVKGRNEMSSFGAYYAADITALKKFISLWGDLNSEENGNSFPCIQQRISGAGCGFFALYEHGICRQYFMHRRVREVPESGGASSCAESIHENDLLEAGKAVLDALNWHGVAMVEFKRDQATQQLYLIEINPKFWGSLELSYASGINFSYLDALLADRRCLPDSVTYRVGKRFQWLLPDEIKHLRTRPSSIYSVLFDFLNWNVGSNIWLTDPLPTVGFVWDTACRAVGFKKK